MLGSLRAHKPETAQYRPREGTSRDEARTEAGCPVCGARPGDACTYMHDLFTYSDGPSGRVKELAHRRGDPLASGVHSERAGTATAQYLEARDVRIARLYAGGAGVLAVAVMEGVTRAAVYDALRRQGTRLRDGS